MKYLKHIIINIILTHNVSGLTQNIRLNEYCENIQILPSRKGIKKAIKKGEIRLNGKHAEGGRYINNNDQITLVDLEDTPPKPYHLKLEVVFEDNDLAIINKPAGISVSGNQFKTIQNALLFNIKTTKTKDALKWPLPVHRLDNQTSGLLIIAKTKTARVRLGQAFENKTIEKTYHAIVIGEIAAAVQINNQIENKIAQTNFTKIITVPSLKSGKLTLISASPKTGRTHQIRLHCQRMNTPILGDKLYGKPNLTLKHKGLFLAATGLKFPHPISKKILTIEIPIPKKFHNRLKNEERRYKTYYKS